MRFPFRQSAGLNVLLYFLLTPLAAAANEGDFQISGGTGGEDAREIIDDNFVEERVYLGLRQDRFFEPLNIEPEWKRGSISGVSYRMNWHSPDANLWLNTLTISVYETTEESSRRLRERLMQIPVGGQPASLGVDVEYWESPYASAAGKVVDFGSIVVRDRNLTLSLTYSGDAKAAKELIWSWIDEARSDRTIAPMGRFTFEDFPKLTVTLPRNADQHEARTIRTELVTTFDNPLRIGLLRPYGADMVLGREISGVRMLQGDVKNEVEIPDEVAQYPGEPLELYIVTDDNVVLVQTIVFGE